MKPVSTGTGLIVLSATIAACFAISQLESQGKAIAAPGNPTTRQPNAPTLMPHGMLPQGAGIPGVHPTGSPSTWSGNFAASDVCQDLEPDVRFTGPLHPITQCVDSNTGWFRWFGSADNGSHDINGDGVLEHFSWNLDNLNQETSPDAPALFRTEIVLDGTTTSVRYQPVLLAAPFVAFIQSQLNLSYSSCNLSGWRDMDNDGDLDPIFGLTLYYGDGGFSAALGWLENSGYPVSPPRSPYDLDGNGRVNTADLSLLLMEFTD
jgi:hypothetical protein